MILTQQDLMSVQATTEMLRAVRKEFGNLSSRTLGDCTREEMECEALLHEFNAGYSARTHQNGPSQLDIYCIRQKVRTVLENVGRNISRQITGHDFDPDEEILGLTEQSRKVYFVSPDHLYGTVLEERREVFERITSSCRDRAESMDLFLGFDERQFFRELGRLVQEGIVSNILEISPDIFGKIRCFTSLDADRSFSTLPEICTARSISYSHVDISHDTQAERHLRRIDPEFKWGHQYPMQARIGAFSNTELRVSLVNAAIETIISPKIAEQLVSLHRKGIDALTDDDWARYEQEETELSRELMRACVIHYTFGDNQNLSQLPSDIFFRVFTANVRSLHESMSELIKVLPSELKGAPWDFSEDARLEQFCDGWQNDSYTPPFPEDNFKRAMDECSARLLDTEAQTVDAIFITASMDWLAELLDKEHRNPRYTCSADSTERIFIWHAKAAFRDLFIARAMCLDMDYCLETITNMREG